MLIPNDQVNILMSTSSVMIIFILLFLLTKLQFIVLSAQRLELAPINYLALNLTQRVTLEYAE